MRLPSLFACLALSACASVVPSTAARLAATDPLTADPGAIALVVVLPPGLSVTPGSAVLEFGATRGTKSRKGRYVLAEEPVPVGVVVQRDGSAQGYTLTDADAESMRALQAEIAGWKREGAAQGSLSLGIGGCAVGDGPAPDAVGSVLIRMAEDGPFLPLIREGKLADLLGAEVLAAIEPCKGAE
ncbi:MAG: hypothetical protein MUE52_02315 [Tabrizicola sp.]|jgi:hypothetical protein|nr:hypothetical protein [Tabrizicola sp.]